MRSGSQHPQKVNLLQSEDDKNSSFKVMRRSLSVFLMVFIVLVACRSEPVPELKPRLVVSNSALSLTAASPQEFILIRNEGEENSILEWSISTESTILVISPSEGSVNQGQEQLVTITADQDAISSDSPLLEQLIVESNGGQKSIWVSFRVDGTGLAACGTFPTITANSRFMQPSDSANAGATYIPGELLIKYKEPLALQADGQAVSFEARQLFMRQREQSLALKYAFEVKKAASPLRPSLIQLSEGQDVLAYAARLEQDPAIEYAEPNYYLETLATPDDVLYAEQWSLSQFGLPEAWDRETGTKDVVIAVIDSGVDMNHEDLIGKMLPGCDFFNEDNDPNPGLPNGGKSEHGTHVAGIAAAMGNNTTGIAGVAYGSGVQILPIKVFDDAGVNGKVDNLIDAILWAAGIPIEGVGVNPKPADIINMSLGVRPEFINERLESIADAVQQAKSKGVVLFAASGNEGSSSQILSPASDPNVIAIGSVDQDYSRSSFSNYDSSGEVTVDLVAPGGKGSADCAGNGVYSTYPENTQYACLQGTSMASPFAAGVAALMLSQNPGLSPDQIKANLIASAFYDDSTMNPEEYGSGIICADKALGTATQCGR